MAKSGIASALGAEDYGFKSRHPDLQFNVSIAAMSNYDDLRQKAIALRKAGFSNGQIGRRLGVASATVWRWVRHIPFEGFNEAAVAEQMEARRNPELYQQAIELRKQGYSYNLIIQQLGVSKSTLSGWLKDVTFAEYHPAVRERIERTAKAAGAVQTAKAEKLKADAEAEAVREMNVFLGAGLSDRELFVSGLMLYWGEGTKKYVSLGMTNSDPIIIRTFIIWLQKFLGIHIGRLRALVNIYPDIVVDEALDYWSAQTGIPSKQFYKTQIDKRDNKLTYKKGKLKYGTVHVRVVGVGSITIKHKVLKWIELYADYLANMRV